MIRFKALRALCALSLVTFSLGATPSTYQTRLPLAGYTFDISTRATTSASAASSGLTGRGIAGPDGAVRIDIVALDGPSSYSAVGDYFISKNGGLILVRPTTKTFVDMQEVTAGQGLSPQMLASATVTDVNSKVDEVPGAESIDGRVTRHVRATVGYSLSIGPMTVPTTIVADYWLAKVSVPMINPLSGSKALQTTGPLVDLVKKQIEVTPNVGAGVAMKSFVATSRTAMGQTTVSTTTTEIKNLKEGTVDASTIVVPEGYTKAAR